MATDKQHIDAEDGQDYFDKIAKDFEQEREAENEEIARSNEHGNGFANDMKSSEAPSKTGSYNPQKLNARHREIIRLHCLGYKGTMIAKMLGCTPQLIYQITNSPLGEALISEIQQARTGNVQDVQQRLQEASPLAAEIIVDVMNEGKKESNKLKAALKLLEMTGHKPGETVQHNHLHMTKDDIEKAKQRARKEDKQIADKGKSFNESNRPSGAEQDIQDAEVIEEEE